MRFTSRSQVRQWTKWPDVEERILVDLIALDSADTRLMVGFSKLAEACEVVCRHAIAVFAAGDGGRFVRAFAV
jgi:hypothetical protein